MNQHRLSGLDSAFLHLERGPAHMHVGGTMIFEGPAPEYEEFQQAISERLHLVPRFRQKVRFVPLGQGRPKWVDDPHFNLDYHVRHTALPPPGSEEQLRTLAARIFSQRLDRSKPLWELWLADGLEGNRFGLVTKTHHALIDGVSGIDLATVLFDTEREPAPVPEGEPWAPHPEPSGVQVLGEALVERATSPAEIARSVKSLVRAPRQAAGAVVDALDAAGTLARAGLAAPPSHFNVDIGPYRRFAVVGADLGELKRIKNEVGGTVNDVVLAVVAGAVGRYLRGRGYSTQDLELRAMVPISVRAADERGALGNRVSSFMAPLPVWCEDPIERLRTVSATMGDLKESKQAVGASLLTELTDFAPPTITGQAARLQSRQRFFNLVVTNVPGPQFPLYLMGRELQALFPMVPLAKRQAVCFGIMSYNGQVNFGLVGDYDAMPDLEELARDVEWAISELSDAAAPKAKRPRRKRAASAKQAASA